jgi:hypothetical protein
MSCHLYREPLATVSSPSGLRRVAMQPNCLGRTVIAFRSRDSRSGCFTGIAHGDALAPAPTAVLNLLRAIDAIDYSVYAGGLKPPFRAAGHG